MTLHVSEIMVPAETDRPDAVTETVETRQQWVRQAAVFFPPGCNGEVRVELLSGGERLWPSRQGDPAAGNGVVGPASIRTELPGRPNNLMWRVWSPDADFAHTVIARVETTDPAQGRWRDFLGRFFGGGGESFSFDS